MNKILFFFLVVIVFGSLSFKRQYPSISVLDYGAVGNGVHHDDTAIVNALAYLGTQGGGTLLFPSGKTYRIVHSNTGGESEYVMNVPTNVVVIATGAIIGSTADGSWCFRLGGSNTSWTGGTFKKGGLEITSSCITIANLRIDSAWDHAFHLSSGKSNVSAFIHKIYSNITLQNCYAFNPNRHGFAMHRGPYGFSGSDSQFLGVYQNIRLINDTAIGAGISLISPYDYGFGMENIIGASNILYQNCYSKNSQGSGYHVEFQIVFTNPGCSYINCKAETNGVSGRSGYPYGIMYRDSFFTIQNCTTINNFGGAYAQIPDWNHGQVAWVNSGEQGFTAINYNSQTFANYSNFITNFPAYAVPACGTIYVQGATGLPMKTLYTDLIKPQTITEIYQDTGTGAWLNQSHYAAVTQSLSFDNATRPTSIATQPIRVDTTKQYRVNVAMRIISGTTGTPILYIQEFDKNALLIKPGFNYTIKKSITGLTTDTVRSTTQLFGHGTANPFQANTVYVRVSLNEDELVGDNRLYSLSQFSCVPL